MSSIASFYLMESSNFHEYAKLAGLQQTENLPNLADDDKQVVVYAGGFNAAEIERDPRFKNARNAFDFLRSHSSQPFQFQWSGYVLYDLLELLKDDKQIDLISKGFAKTPSDTPSYLLDASVKELYLTSIDPVHFSEKQLETDYQNRSERLKEKYFKEMASKLPPHELKKFMDLQNDYVEEPFPERGIALMDGITILHGCLNLVNDIDVVIMQIG